LFWYTDGSLSFAPKQRRPARNRPSRMWLRMVGRIPLSAIKDLAVLFPGDLHDLAVFLLKAYDARDREANAQNPRVLIGPTRPTLHGLAAQYARVTDIPLSRVEEELAKAGFALGGIVDFDPADSANEEALTPQPT